MKLTYFKLRSCPYCRAADKWLSELRAEKPEYADIEIEEIVENEQKALADSYDYYYVPCFFLGKSKLHEGAATKEKLRAVLDSALNASV